MTSQTCLQKENSPFWMILHTRIMEQVNLNISAHLYYTILIGKNSENLVDVKVIMIRYTLANFVRVMKINSLHSSHYLFPLIIVWQLNLTNVEEITLNSIWRQILAKNQ